VENDEAVATSNDEQAIESVARAYLESWLDGDGARMRAALSPSLAKRGLDYAADLAPTGIHHLDAEYMVASAGRGPRRQYERTCTITILDVADNIASVKVVSEPFVDYLHLAKLGGRWTIVNALYEDREPSAP
jgi:Putative lumazine-binding